MPLQPYFDMLEPADQRAEIWRFRPFDRFQDLIANEELYFCRSDLFPQDEQEGIPPEEYLCKVKGYARYVLEDERNLNHDMGCLAQFREMYYVNCWHLFGEEKPGMWEGFAQNGVAICSRFDLLKSALNGMLDNTHLGLVRYGSEPLTKTMRINTLQFINTKRLRYKDEREVRAIVECMDPLASINRHFDADSWPHRRPLLENPRHHWVSDYKRRRVDLNALLTKIVVAPGAPKQVFEEAELWVRTKGFSCTVQLSSLAERSPAAFGI
jgi:hypothetical protein